MLKIVGLCTAALAAIIVLKNVRSEYAFFLKLAVLLLIGVPVVGLAAEAISQLQALSAQAGIDSDVLKLLVKALGICLTAQLAANLCQDSGESALASAVELLGRGAILLMALPLAAQLISWSLTWIDV
ncbi:MAG TPA: hypothetical protein IAD00_05615 [Candidatus Fimenecus stercoravium]|nr:hypothetical protein [Candidatus Fimenecus stercoravium]